MSAAETQGWNIDRVAISSDGVELRPVRWELLRASSERSRLI